MMRGGLVLWTLAVLAAAAPQRGGGSCGCREVICPNSGPDHCACINAAADDCSRYIGYNCPKPGRCIEQQQPPSYPAQNNSPWNNPGGNQPGQHRTTMPMTYTITTTIPGVFTPRPITSYSTIVSMVTVTVSAPPQPPRPQAPSTVTASTAGTSGQPWWSKLPPTGQETPVAPAAPAPPRQPASPPAPAAQPRPPGTPPWALPPAAPASLQKPTAASPAPRPPVWTPSGGSPGWTPLGGASLPPASPANTPAPAPAPAPAAPAPAPAAPAPAPADTGMPAPAAPGSPQKCGPGAPKPKCPSGTYCDPQPLCSIGEDCAGVCLPQVRRKSLSTEEGDYERVLDGSEDAELTQQPWEYRRAVWQGLLDSGKYSIYKFGSM